MSNVTDNQTQYTFVSKEDIEEQFQTIGGIDAIVNSHAATITNAVVSFFAACIKKSVPGALAMSVIQGAVAAQYEHLKSLLDEFSNESDWCIVITTVYGFTGWSGGYPTYSKIVSIRCDVETGEA